MAVPQAFEDAEFQSTTTKISGFELPVKSNSIPEKLIEMIKTAVQNQMPAELFPQNDSNAITSSSRSDETELSVHLIPKQKEFPFTLTRLALQNPVESFSPEKPIEMSENQMSDEIEIILQNDPNVVASSPKIDETEEQYLQLFPALCDSVLSRINSNLKRIKRIQKHSSNLTPSRHRTDRPLINNRDQPIHPHACRGSHGHQTQMDKPTKSSIGMSSIQTFACLDDADCGEVEGNTVVKATGNEKLEDGIQNDEIEGVQDKMQNNELRGVQDGTLNNGNHLISSLVFFVAEQITSWLQTEKVRVISFNEYLIEFRLSDRSQTRGSVQGNGCCKTHLHLFLLVGFMRILQPRPAFRQL